MAITLMCAIATVFMPAPSTPKHLTSVQETFAARDPLPGQEVPVPVAATSSNTARQLRQAVRPPPHTAGTQHFDTFYVEHVGRCNNKRSMAPNSIPARPTYSDCTSTCDRLADCKGFNHDPHRNVCEFLMVACSGLADRDIQRRPLHARYYAKVLKLGALGVTADELTQYEQESMKQQVAR